MTENELIFYSGLLGVLIIFLALIYLQNKKSKDREDVIISANTELRLANQELQIKRSNMFQSIIKIYGQEKADFIEKGGIYIGMNSTLLDVAKGDPDYIKENILKGIKIEKWFYGKYINRLGNSKYTFEITIEDSIVTGWKDLK